MIPRRTILGGLAAAMLAGCELTPQPFVDQHLAPEDPLVRPGPWASVLVTPVRNIGPAQGQTLADALAEALRQLELPASSRSASRRSYVITGIATPETTGPRQIHWAIIDPSGRTHASYDQPLPAAVLAGGDQALNAYAVAAARQIEPLLADPGSLRHQPPKVTIRGMSGAPGDGDSSLPAALKELIRRHRVAVIADGDPNAFVITGVMTVTPGTLSNTQVVQLEWSVLSPAGKVVGNVTQTNTIPAGSLNGPWGDTAAAAAEGALEGLARIFDTLGPT